MIINMSSSNRTPLVTKRQTSLGDITPLLVRGERQTSLGDIGGLSSLLEGKQMTSFQLVSDNARTHGSSFSTLNEDSNKVNKKPHHRRRHTYDGYISTSTNKLFSNNKEDSRWDPIPLPPPPSSNTCFVFGLESSSSSSFSSSSSHLTNHHSSDSSLVMPKRYPPSISSPIMTKEKKKVPILLPYLRSVNVATYDNDNDVDDDHNDSLVQLVNDAIQMVQQKE